MPALSLPSTTLVLLALVERRVPYGYSRSMLNNTIMWLPPFDLAVWTAFDDTDLPSKI